MFGKKPVETELFTLPVPDSGLPPSPLINHGTPPVGGNVQANTLSSSIASIPNASSPEVVGIAHYRDSKLETPEYREAKRLLISEMLDNLDFQVLERIPIEQRRSRIDAASDKIIPNIPIPINDAQIRLIKAQTLDEILGFGPIEALLQDPNVNDIMINTSKRIYIERAGKIFLTDIEFNSEQHLIGIVQRIVSRVGRRIDEANPMVDARMPDGSRFNAIVPPLALDGALVSIRKFKKHKMPLNNYIELNSMSPEMAKFLSIAGAIRLNIIISGGTGSGKTTLLNALSGNIDPGERVITIEDAAELQLHQPHVLRLETRPSSLEGRGEITQRALVKNALRMRPDRIILGEIRGEEVIDVLSAMNTGHDGSMATIHANSPKDCLIRIENLVAMSSVQVQSSSLRQQIASAVQLIVQIQRMRDGRRRVTGIEEIVGYDSGVIISQSLFSYRFRGLRPDGVLDGEFVAHPVRPANARKSGLLWSHGRSAGLLYAGERRVMIALFAALAIGIVSYFGFVMMFPKALPEESNNFVAQALDRLYEENRSAEAESGGLLRDQLRDATPFIRKFFGLPIMQPLYEVGAQAGYQTNLRGLLIFMCTTMAVVAGLLIAADQALLAIVAAPVFGYFIPYRHCLKRVRKRNRKFIDQFPDALDMIVRSVRSGFPLSVSLQMLAENTEDPLRAEFRQWWTK